MSACIGVHFSLEAIVADSPDQHSILWVAVWSSPAISGECNFFLVGTFPCKLSSYISMAIKFIFQSSIGFTNLLIYL